MTKEIGKIPIYMQLANDINAQIESGVYKSGERLPSVRKMSESRKFSVTTVIRAYQELENRNLLTVLPQSGYYISYKKNCYSPDISFNISKPQPVNVINLVNLVLHDSFNQTMLPLGSGLPPENLLPVAQINKMLVKALRSKELKHNYTGNAEGYLPLRKQIVQLMFLLNVRVNHEDILITSGCNEAIFLAFASICKEGDQVAVESPCYFGVLQILQELKLKVIEIPSDCSNGINLDILKFVLENYNIKLIYVNSNCNNPLGSTIPSENKKRLAEIVAQFSVPLVEDDSNGELYFSRNRPDVVKAYDKEGMTLYCSSFSKTLAPSYRVGWIIPGIYRDRIIRLKQAINTGTSFLFQAALADYLESGQYERHLRRIRHIYNQRVKQMSEDILDSFPENTFVTSPNGGYNLWVQLPENINSLKLYNLSKENKISITPGSIFSIDTKYDHYIRLSAAYYTKEMDVFIRTLGNLAGKCAD